MQGVCAVLCNMWPVRLCYSFPHYLINGMISWKKLLNIKCVLIFSTTLVWNIYHSTRDSARCYKNVHRSSCQEPFIIVRFKRILNFLDIWSKYQFHENLSVGAELFHVDGQRDMAKLTVVFRKFANAPKMRATHFFLRWYF